MSDLQTFLLFCIVTFAIAVIGILRETKPQDVKERIVAALRLAADRGADANLLSRATGVDSGNLYPALYDLEGEGAVRSWWVGSAWPRRRFYALATRTTDRKSDGGA